jgi:hypothetical protein
MRTTQGQASFGHSVQTLITYSNELKTSLNRHRRTRLFNVLRRMHIFPSSTTHKSAFIEIFYHPGYSGKAEPYCQATLVEFASQTREAVCARSVDTLLTNFSFLMMYMPNSRRVPRVGRVWLAKAHTQAIIPNTTVNVMHPKRPSWTLPLANRPRAFIACAAYASLHNVGFYSLVFQIHQSCMRRELPCSIHTYTRKPSLAHWARYPCLQTLSNKFPKCKQVYH